MGFLYGALQRMDAAALQWNVPGRLARHLLPAANRIIR